MTQEDQQLLQIQDGLKEYEQWWSVVVFDWDFTAMREQNERLDREYRIYSFNAF